MRGTPVTIKGVSWSAKVDIENETPFSLSMEEVRTPVSLSMDGVSVGDLDETAGIGLKSVAHERLDRDGVEMETEVVVPFGNEPRISRKMEFPGAGNVIKFTTDIHASASEGISIDPLTFSGEWRRFAVATPKDFASSSELDWTEIDPSKQHPGPILETSPPPLTLLLEDSQGVVVEISTGFDLWRWGFEQGRPKVVFRLSTTSEGALRLTRSLPPDSDSIKKHPYRFTWILAWSTRKKLEAPIDDKLHVHLPQPDLSKIPTTAMESWRGTRGQSPCARTKPFRNALRKIIRSAHPPQIDSILILQGPYPSLCDVPGHLERSGDRPLPHWSHRELLDFHFWANRQLRKKNATFAFKWNKKEIFPPLPSFKHMEYPIDIGLLTVEREQ